MNFRITILCENSVGPISGTLGEHGFSALIEAAHGEPLLFDTGQGLTLLHNARRMNKDLTAVTKVIISHGHYDHSGGLLPLLSEYGPKSVYAHPGVFAPRFRVRDTGESHSIGIPYERAVLEAAGACFDLLDDFRELSAGVFLTGEVPALTSFEVGDRGLYLDCSGQERDTTPDDQSLVLESEQGLVVVLGCCHAGLINTLEHIVSQTGRRDIYAVIGGTHLAFCSQEQQFLTMSAIRSMGIKKLVASHCTGFTASARLARELPKAFQMGMVGYTLEV